MLRIFFVFNCFCFLNQPNALACGYSFVGDCSSNISLRINGVTDSFAVATCHDVLQFDGFSLGPLQTLSITKAKAVTWESCQNNVAGVALYYRVYEMGAPGGVWQNFNLQQDYQTLVGPYTTRYRSQNSNIDLTNGLVIGNTYVLEIYYQAAVDTIGDDFIPETVMLQNNNGQNYHFTFEYGGASAPPFLVAVTKNRSVKCHGGSTGVAGVTVYGNQSGLFYQWSTGGNNFPVLTNIPAGTYSVTVNGNNYTASKTIEISEPQALNAQFYPVSGLGCGGLPGHATVVPEGGVPPYYFLWDNGQQIGTATFSSGGAHAVTVTDSNGCKGFYSVNIPAQPIVQITVAAEICKGDSMRVGGQYFDTAGFYEFGLPGSNGACDTAVQLTLSVLYPGSAFASLPDSALISCIMPEIDLCATPIANTSFQWSKDGVPAITLPCLPATAGGDYMLSATTTGTMKACLATKTIKVEEHLFPPTLSAGGILEYTGQCYQIDSVVMNLTANTDAQGALFTWWLNGNVISQADTCRIVWEYNAFPPVFPVPTVSAEDQYGCKTGIVTPLIGIIQPPIPPVLEIFSSDPDFCTGLIDVTTFVFGGEGPLTVQWGDSIVTPGDLSFPPGQYPVVITDVNGCQTESEVDLPELFFVWVNHSIGGNDGDAWVSVPGDGWWYTYLWSNGSTEPFITNLGAGEYCVTITDTLRNCSVDTCLSVLVSVSDPANQDVQISPNPAAPGQQVDLRLPGIPAGQETTFEVVDVQGRFVDGRSVRNESDRFLFHIPEDAVTGFFMIRIRQSNGTSFIGKLLVR